MGWLRDSMRQAPGAPRSFGSVARAALGHPEWPKDSRPQARSLAALLSKLDRGIELEWLADRPAVRQVLADVIGAPRSRIEDAAGIALGRPDEARLRLRFDDLPYASTFDLTVESLPSAMPEPVLNPAAWRRIWWVAPSGSGRSLVGTWLAARRLASFVAAPDFREAAARLPSAGPAFVELWSEDGEHVRGWRARRPPPTRADLRRGTISPEQRLLRSMDRRFVSPTIRLVGGGLALARATPATRRPFRR